MITYHDIIYIVYMQIIIMRLKYYFSPIILTITSKKSKTATMFRRGVMRLQGTAQARAMSNSMKEINTFLVDEQLHG